MKQQRNELGYLFNCWSELHAPIVIRLEKEHSTCRPRATHELTQHVNLVGPSLVYALLCPTVDHTTQHIYVSHGRGHFVAKLQ